MSGLTEMKRKTVRNCWGEKRNVNISVNIMIIELLSMCTLVDQTRVIYVVLGVAYMQTSTLKSHKMKSVRILRLI